MAILAVSRLMVSDGGDDVGGISFRISVPETRMAQRAAKGCIRLDSTQRRRQARPGWQSRGGAASLAAKGIPDAKRWGSDFSSSELAKRLWCALWVDWIGHGGAVPDTSRREGACDVNFHGVPVRPECVPCTGWLSAAAGWFWGALQLFPAGPELSTFIKAGTTGKQARRYCGREETPPPPLRWGLVCAPPVTSKRPSPGAASTSGELERFEVPGTATLRFLVSSRLTTSTAPRTRSARRALVSALRGGKSALSFFRLLIISSATRRCFGDHARPTDHAALHCG
ncbi:hypothetical protein B0T26DRAFT_75207 [Lasiosphaeria miniovina]|uniref:Uncharacterized protein n=1 Tax=Lasiosphaeria miniovina TaxID=1954250 RepID=A0AA40EEI2_9PEZI|nr:uncharacterized protein B0T26DRAFT_75207 [Lasiosphaeria miniovina]KAK0734541.1 hypothetical protein B0T26DRAFT_75207 [Lasiosphaeria miniovina]